MVRYEQNKDEFILEDYDRAKTFSDFMPAIAGVSGIPLWVYFVNRGQCVCSIGVNDKNNSITEFMPANKALLNVERLGFRTFVKAGGRCAELYADKSTPKKLVSSNNRLTVCDTLEGFLSAEVTYTQLAWQNIPALMRRLKLTNLGKETIEVNCTDGLAQIVPNGINDYQLKNVSNLSCAYSNAVYSNGLIKYQVEYTTADHAKVSKNRGANFYCSAASSGEKPFYIYDPDLVFGSDCALTRAEKLFSSTEEELRAANQAVVFKMATAFSMYDFKLAPGESAEIYSAVGSVKDEAKLSEVASVFSGAEAFEREMRRSGRVIEEITKEIGIRTGDGLFDQYVRQSFVDNVLRGGMPVRIRGKKGGEVIHYVYSRKHGDLEREYNWFVVPATKYSGGTGNYRDLCQNRRSDVIFFPFVGDYNIKMFYSFLQLDGYNPLVIKQPVYVPEDGAALSAAFEKYGVPQETREEVKKGLDISSLAEIFPEEFLGEYLSGCRMEYAADFSEGYWTDHFSYNLDLVENYLRMYPDREKELLFGSRYRYYSSGVRVLPLKDRLVEQDGKLCAYNSIVPAGKDCWYKAKDGKEVTLDLFGKLAGCALVKSATLDSQFIGLEMEGGKPGWNDAMNGLPGMNASSVPDGMEVYRLNAFLIGKCAGLEKFELLEEQAELLERMLAAADKEDVYVRFIEAKEDFRAKVYAGLSGKTVEVRAEKLAALLYAVNKKIKEAIGRAQEENGGIIPTFVPFEVTREGDGFSLKNLRFKKMCVASFLEANAKGLKIKGFCDPEKLYAAVRASDMFDKKLKVYKTSESLENESPMIGRVRTFSPGLYERESCFLHMHYKYLLGLLESGLYDEFYRNMHEGFVCYMDPSVYGRSVLQNSSFIVSSAGRDKALVGRGFQPRLTGANAEVISMVIGMFLGEKLFYMDGGRLCFAFEPKLHASLFDEKGEASFRIFGTTDVVFENPEKINTYDGKVVSLRLIPKSGGAKTVDGGVLCGKDAEALRGGSFARIEVRIGSR